MFERRFAKYARAISDEGEREWLYKKYRTKTIVSIIFYVLCVAVIAGALALNPYIEQDWALAVMTVLIFAWIGFAVASLCLWISFKRTYSTILNRPSYAGEMPEVVAYRKKVADDKKSTLKKLWWAWAVFGICAVLFIVFIAMDIVRNPESEEFGAWGTAAIWVLLAGVLVIAFAYIFNNSAKQQQGKTVEQQTESEASAIDKAQGRKHEYNIQADNIVQTTYKYLFPNAKLRGEADEIRKKYSKILTAGVVACSAVAIIAAIVLMCSASIFDNNLSGYAMPIVLTCIFVGAFIFSMPMTIKLNDVEKRQKKELEARPEYAKNLEWYQLNDSFYKFKGKILFILIAVGIVTGWVLAILFPAAAWSLLSVVPIMIGALVNIKLVKGLRQKSIPLEREIDAEQKRLMPPESDGENEQ